MQTTASDLPRFETPAAVTDYIKANTVVSLETTLQADESIRSMMKVFSALATLDQHGHVVSKMLPARGADDIIDLNDEINGRKQVHVILRTLAQLGLVERFPPASTVNGTYRLTETGRRWIESLHQSKLIEIR